MGLAGRFKSGSFLHGVFLLAGGSALGGAITWAVSPLLSRLFSPEDFAVYGAVTSLTILLRVFGAMQIAVYVLFSLLCWLAIRQRTPVS